jgi:hypothetical protein
MCVTATPDHLPDRSGRRAFRRLASGPCPPITGFLLVLSASLEPVDDRGADERLDDLARSVFGLLDADGHTQMNELANVLTRAPAFTIDETTPAGLHLDRALQQRAGHPLILATVLAEIGRRAGLETGVYSSPNGWYAGRIDHETLWLVDPATRQMTAPEVVRRHCGHELAYAVLLGLAHRYASQGDRELAERAGCLRRQMAFEKNGVTVDEAEHDPLSILWASAQ